MIRGWGKSGIGEKDGDGASQGTWIEERTRGYGQWGGVDCGSEGRVGESNGEKSGTTVTEKQ